MSRAPSYARAGVDLDAAAALKERLRQAVARTHGPEVLCGFGAFGGAFSLAGLRDMREPVLVASTDGVGTKTMVAARMGRWDTLGRDLVNHCVNDVLVQGARPLFFLDYLAGARLDPEVAGGLVEGVAAACEEAGCALLGGETALMPGVYAEGQVDLAGTLVGVAERDRLLDGSAVRPGDAILALPSTGLHTNGYSLARQVLDGEDWTVPRDDLGASIGEALLAVHRSYLPEVSRLLDQEVALHALCHVTGGGVVENLPRVLPPGTAARLQWGSWPEPPIFGLIRREGGVAEEEMRRVFNLGLGMLVLLPSQAVEAAVAVVPDLVAVGTVTEGS